MSEKEIWKDIKGYEGLYEISNLGRVKSLKFGKEKILRYGNDCNGYLNVILYKNGERKKCYVQRLVAQTFLDNPNNYPQVNHKDENKLNNCVDNLEFCTAKYNCNYGTRNDSTKKPILQFTKNGEFIKKWDSAREIERTLNIANQNITRCCKCKRKYAGGYVFMYATFGEFTIDITKLKKVA